jgi:hypothetical protein
MSGSTATYRKKWKLANPEKVKEQSKRWREKNKQKIKEYREKNKGKMNEYRKRWRIKNGAKIKENRKVTPPKQKPLPLGRDENKQKIRIKEWKKDNKEKVREGNRRYKMLRMKRDPSYRLSARFGTAISDAVTGAKKRIRWSHLVGYDVETLKNHLESKFQPGMTWENYGKNGWHIDHIIPKSSFHYTSYEDEEFKKCWSLSNLQPLWAADNMAKGNKMGVAYGQ